MNQRASFIHSQLEWPPLRGLTHPGSPVKRTQQDSQDTSRMHMSILLFRYTATGTPRKTSWNTNGRLSCPALDRIEGRIARKARWRSRMSSTLTEDQGHIHMDTRWTSADQHSFSRHLHARTLLQNEDTCKCLELHEYAQTGE